MAEQDIIAHLIDVEREASELLGDAQKENESRKNAAREKAERAYRDSYAETLHELDVELDKAKALCDARRDAEYASYSDGLASLPRDTVAFNETFDSFMAGV
jgi:vacuolar-type H+-ATPase subunit H